MIKKYNYISLDETKILNVFMKKRICKFSECTLNGRRRKSIYLIDGHYYITHETGKWFIEVKVEKVKKLLLKNIKFSKYENMFGKMDREVGR